ncbi:transcriptional regulator [Tatumella morbirosei]|uniref:Transcriptional regulator n=1 Tax=Tatumella morbirosei TaxID=642227 RepID=A0A095UBX5_9GAMM|nr:LysR family transcriptional regulator [Tatumella morbirosei]KGD71948.1 transcriptional regulator [Tatumella morbirosei]
MRNLDDIEAFVRVVECGDFTGAARIMNVTAGAVSKQIKRLEQSLGITLFERSTRKIRMTGAGLEIYEHFKTGLESFYQAKLIAEHGLNSLSGSIAISSPSTFNHYFLIPAIDAFRKLHPDVSFSLESSDRIVDLYASGIDIAVRSAELADSRLIARKLFDQRRVVVCAPELLSGVDVPMNIADLARLPAVVFGYPGYTPDSWILEHDEGNKVQSVRPKKMLMTDDGMALLTWTLQGQGIALRESWSINDYQQHGELIRLMPEWQESVSSLWLIRTSHRGSPVRLNVFSEFLINFCRQKLPLMHGGSL